MFPQTPESTGVSEDIFNRPRQAAQAPYAGFDKRTSAYLIDGFFMMLMVLPIALVMGDSDEPSSAGSLLSLMIGLIYQGFLPTTAWQGTLGKKLLHLKIETLDGQRINNLTSLKRLSLHLILQTVIIVVPGALGLSQPAEALPVMSLALAVLIADFGMALYRPDRRTIHDLIAGTVVRRYAPEGEDETLI